MAQWYNPDTEQLEDDGTGDVGNNYSTTNDSSGDDEFQQFMTGAAGDDEFQQFMTGAAGDDKLLLRYVEQAKDSGVNTPLTKTLQDTWKGASTFAKDNKEILGMVGAGVSNAQKDKNASERQDKQNQYTTASAAQKRAWDLEDAARKKADEKELWDRHNQSIIDTKLPDNLGIIGKNMFDSQVAYMQSRKK